MPKKKSNYAFQYDCELIRVSIVYDSHLNECVFCIKNKKTMISQGEGNAGLPQCI